MSPDFYDTLGGRLATTPTQVIPQLEGQLRDLQKDLAGQEKEVKDLTNQVTRILIVPYGLLRVGVSVAAAQTSAAQSAGQSVSTQMPHSSNNPGRNLKTGRGHRSCEVLVERSGRRGQAIRFCCSCREGRRHGSGGGKSFSFFPLRNLHRVPCICISRDIKKN